MLPAIQDLRIVKRSAIHDLQRDCIAETFAQPLQAVWQFPLDRGHYADACTAAELLEALQRVLERLLGPGV
jgi:hypothetical protein